eukprot:TRINITY_DN5426_c0_g1_i1.p1 TRINITY_DN5426_c0_g1~~TRINITY_DN5426_c0_g1_i1.p1  ORF type:complete len:539 (-),score=195.90 TRINITY_DN5426_c0_g1_i1:14-1474(-)
MSSIYITEPQTKGKVVLKTSIGDLDVELWPKEAPKAVRNFVQLCMEGYFDGNIFHRVIKNFIAQTGDPTGEGFGGQSIYDGQPFDDEFHSRLRFSHRGIVAMATSEPNQNQSQFFVTLDKAPDLQNKHTIFGKVTGDTIFNILKLNDLQVDENERPLYPPKIISAEILSNPFDDIKPRKGKIVAPEKSKKDEKENKGNVPQVKKNFNLLSFGDDAEQEEQDLESSSDRSKKMKSAAYFSDHPEAKKSAEEVEKLKEKMRESENAKKLNSGNESSSSSVDALKTTKEKLHHHNKKRKTEGNSSEQQDVDYERILEEENRKKEEERIKNLKEEQERLKKEIRSISKKEKEEKTEKILSVLDLERVKYLEKKKQSAGKKRIDEKDIMSKLSAFTQQLKEAQPAAVEEVTSNPFNTQAEERIDAERLEDVAEDSSWMSHSLQFQKERQTREDKKRKDLEDIQVWDSKKNSGSSRGMSQHKRRLQGNSNII